MLPYAGKAFVANFTNVPIPFRIVGSIESNGILTPRTIQMPDHPWKRDIEHIDITRFL